MEKPSPSEPTLATNSASPDSAKPMSHDWLSWNPETIDTYPDEVDFQAFLDTGFDCVPEPIGRSRTTRKVSLLRRASNELFRYVAAGVIVGLVSAMVLIIIVLALPNVGQLSTTAVKPVASPTSSSL